jgi:hypothetical protein
MSGLPTMEPHTDSAALSPGSGPNTPRPDATGGHVECRGQPPPHLPDQRPPLGRPPRHRRSAWSRLTGPGRTEPARSPARLAGQIPLSRNGYTGTSGGTAHIDSRDRRSRPARTRPTRRSHAAGRHRPNPERARTSTARSPDRPGPAVPPRAVRPRCPRSAPHSPGPESPTSGSGPPATFAATRPPPPTPSVVPRRDRRPTPAPGGPAGRPGPAAASRRPPHADAPPRPARSS